ncbi:hypothetical protein ASD45_08125 [Pseudolabrys sp. Root1462]|nr:hypothetical protein ASD45_08125 [Pseudolabrys sp. Root1462]
MGHRKADVAVTSPKLNGIAIQLDAGFFQRLIVAAAFKAPGLANDVAGLVEFESTVFCHKKF